MSDIPSILAPPEVEEDEEQETLAPAPAPAAKPAAEEPIPRRPAVGPADESVPSILAEPEGATAGEQVEAGLKAAGGAAVRFSGVVPGAKLGFAAGMAVPPPAQVVTVPLFTLGGGAIGYYAGDLAATELERHGLVIKDPYSVEEQLRPSAVTGEAIGAGLTMTGQTMFLARQAGRLPSSAVGRVINGVLDTARDKPMRFLAAELPALTASATAEGIYEVQRPGHPLERTGVGMAVGVLNPARVVISTTAKTSQIIRGLTQRMSAAGRRTKAGELLLKFMEGAGDDPQAFMRALRETDEIARTIPGFRGTAAQTAGDVRVAQLERELAELERSFFEEASRRAQDSLEAVSNAIALLRGIGDPEALRAVAQLRMTRYTAAFERLLLHARRQAVQAAEDVGRGATVAERGKLSAQMTDIYMSTLQRARDVEADLWRVAFPGDLVKQPAKWTAVRRVYSKLRGELAAADALPDFVEREIETVASSVALLSRVEQGLSKMPDGSKITAATIREATKRTSVGELFRFRSGLLSRARGMARSTSELADQQARQLGLMAEAVLDDMVRAGAATKATRRAGVRRGAGGLLGALETPFDEAREFSRQLNDTFSRSFVGAAQQQGAHGLRVPPETLAKRAFATGDEVATLRFNELREAADFLPTRTLGNPMRLAEANVDAAAMMDAQARLLRIIASRVMEEVTDPDTGQTFIAANLSRARTFLRESGDLLERFPEVKADLEVAVESRQTLDKWVRQVQGLNRHLSTDSPIAQVLNVESPADAVRGALASPKPVERLTEMVTLARGAGDDGVAGLRAAVFDHVIRVAERSDKRIALGQLVDALESPMRPGLPSLRQLMEAEGLLPAAAARRLDQLIDAAGRVMVAVESRAVGEQVLDPTSPIEALLVRAAGSEAARRLLRFAQPEGAGASGPTLIVAYQGARAAQEMTRRLPNEAVKRLLIDALSGEPLQTAGVIRRGFAKVGLADLPPTQKPWSLLEALMETGGTEAEKLQRYYLLHAYAWQAGVLGVEDEFEGVVPPAQDETDEPLPSILRPAGAAEPEPELELPARGEGERELAMHTSTGELNFATVAGAVEAVERVGFGLLSAAVEEVESGGDPAAVSPAGAVGPMQTMPDTLTDPGYGVAPARPGPDGKISEEEMRRVGRDYLMQMLRKYDSDLDLALVAYNWGPANADRWLQLGADPGALPEETRNYVRKVRKKLGVPRGPAAPRARPAR